MFHLYPEDFLSSHIFMKPL